MEEDVGAARWAAPRNTIRNTPKALAAPGTWAAVAGCANFALHNYQNIAHPVRTKAVIWSNREADRRALSL